MSAFLPLADPPFDPLMVADCALWLDSGWGVFNQSGTPAAVGDKIATRFDRATGNVWTQTTDANRPTLQADGLQYGTNRFLQTASPIVYSGDFTHFIVGYVASGSDYLVQMGWPGVPAILATCFGGAAFVLDNAGNTVSVATPSQLIGRVAWSCFRRSGSSAYLSGSGYPETLMGNLGTGTITLPVDGTRQGGVESTTATSRIRVQTGYNRALSPAEIQRVANFLVRQYGAAA